MDISHIEAIIFDFGGVLIQLEPESTIQAFQKLGDVNFKEHYEQIHATNLFTNFEIGKISADYFVNELLAKLPPGTSPNQVVHAWNAMILHVPKETIDLLDNLRKHRRIYLLSNTNSIHIQKAKMEWSKSSAAPLSNCFDHVYLSHEIGLRKPDQEIFEFICQNEQLTPETTLFIDDSIQHVDSAAKLGIKTFHFQRNASIQELFS